MRTFEQDKNGNFFNSQLKALIADIMSIEEYPTWTFLNGVLSCEKVFGDTNIWLWWGELLIVNPGQTKAKEMLRLSDWFIREDGLFQFIGKNQTINR